MATVQDLPKPYLAHLQRTASQPREPDVHPVTLHKITPAANGTVRLLHLSIENQERGIKFLPGQWLDVSIPSVEKVGGFTITSSPLAALPKSTNSLRSGKRDSASAIPPYLELAVQESPKNPPAAYLFKPEKEIMGQTLQVRVGGSFVWPPFRYIARNEGTLPRRVVFVAGGVGINPLMSMLSFLSQTKTMPERVHLLYSTKSTTTKSPAGMLDQVLFSQRLRDIASQHGAPQVQVDFYFTNGQDSSNPRESLSDSPNVSIKNGRIKKEDIEEALGSYEQRRQAVCYVCGPKGMTDELVATISGMQGMQQDQVLCEKWW